MKTAKTRASHSQLILTALKAGEHITGVDAFVRWKCFALPQRIFDLRKQGHKIVSETSSVSGKRWATYHMELASSP